MSPGQSVVVSGRRGHDASPARRRSPRSPSHADTVMGRVISSYTPTVRAGPRWPDSSGTPSTLVAAVPDAPDSPPLDGAAQEADLVREFIPEAAVLPATGGTASRDAVIEVLRQHGIVYLACHGYANWRTCPLAARPKRIRSRRTRRLTSPPPSSLPATATSSARSGPSTIGPLSRWPEISMPSSPLTGRHRPTLARRRRRCTGRCTSYVTRLPHCRAVGRHIFSRAPDATCTRAGLCIRQPATLGTADPYRPVISA